MKLTVVQILDYMRASGCGAYNVNQVGKAFAEGIPGREKTVQLLASADIPVATVDRVLDALENGIPETSSSERTSPGKASEPKAITQWRGSVDKRIVALEMATRASDETIAGQAKAISELSDLIAKLTSIVMMAEPTTVEPVEEKSGK